MTSIRSVGTSFIMRYWRPVTLLNVNSSQRPSGAHDVSMAESLPGVRSRTRRVPATGVYAERVKVLRDSLEQALRALPGPPYERLTRRLTAHASRARRDRR